MASLPIVVASIACGTSSIIAVPSLYVLASRTPFSKGKFRKSYFHHSLYQDADGAATETSQRSLSAILPTATLCVVSTAGLILSTVTSVFVTSGTFNDAGSDEVIVSWLHFAIWVLATFQSVYAALETDAILRFRHAFGAGASCLILAVSIFLEYGGFVRTAGLWTYKGRQVGTIVASLGLALIGFVAGVSVPRRPDVYYERSLVDRQYTGSAYARFTYSWCAHLLKEAATGAGLDLKDLPSLHHSTRSHELHDSFVAEQKRGGQLLQILVRSHWSAFVQQYSLTFLQAVSQILPQVAVYRLLKLLESRGLGADVTWQASSWVIALGLGMILSSFLENFMWWVCYGKLNIPIRLQLSTLIFSKSLRRKDVKGTSGESKESKAAGKEPVTEADEDDGLQKSRQGTINLIGVDSKRISTFATYANLFLSCVAKLAVSFTFLGRLIGWQALLAGLAVQLLAMPLNIYVSQKYAHAQDELMNARDKKLAIINEALNGIRQIKFSALERQWQAKIEGMRNKELNTLWTVFILDTFLIFCWILGPVMLSAVSLSVYAVINHSLSPSIAFTTIGVLQQIEGTLSVVPELTQDLLDAWISADRIQAYLDAPEKQDVVQPGDCIAFNNATLTFPADTVSKGAFMLRDINLRFPNGELSVISGATGSGKSLLLSAILGEAEMLRGSVQVPRLQKDRHDNKVSPYNWIIPNAIAYCSQQPWLENATLRDNILFGLPYDHGRYKKVVAACALEKDIEMLADGELTELGAQGVNVSGGQKWRITFARALYSRAGILILDDIFSALDPLVGRHIFENALAGDLGRNRTRILVTHHVNLCISQTKYQVMLKNGVVEHAGLVEELRKTGSLEDIINAENEEAIVDDDENPTAEAAHGSAVGSVPNLDFIDRRFSTLRGRQGSIRSHLTADALRRFSIASAARRGSHATTVTLRIEDEEAHNVTMIQPRKFIEEETREKGGIKYTVYKQYFAATGGWWFWLVVLIAFGGYQAVILARSWWLSYWTRQYAPEGNTESLVANALDYAHFDPAQHLLESMDSDLKFYLTVYLAFSIFICLEGTIRYLWVYWGSLQASRRLFEKLTYVVLRAPLRWLDTTPAGRILNRMSADFAVIDSELGMAFASVFYNSMMVLGVVVAGVFISPWIIAFAMVLLGICVRYAQYYLAGARDTKRLESIAKSPVFELFSITLAGISSIRAFGKAQSYIDDMNRKLDDHGRSMFYMWAFNRWLTWRLAVVGAAFAIIMAALIVGLPQVDASMAGFALSFVLQYTDAVVYLLRQYANVELGMNATERIVEYSDIPIEDQSGSDAPAAWPTEGRLEVQDLVVSYAPDLPPVLKGVTFSVEGNHRVGVVGRTGAGKSSLTLALFRFLEATRGSVFIDGIDISKISLNDLRSRLSIIPQDPVLFTGTIRSNLDPFSEHTDQELQEALKRVHLVGSSEEDAPTITINDADGDAVTNDTNVNIFASLSSPISEGGLNLSQGQRQLLCLARAIVARPKVFFLDEATSAVDRATDEMIQLSIREEFQNSTLIVIAHRLSTVADFDKILVLGDGQVVEYGSPKELYEKKGAFFSMVEDSGEKDKLREIILDEEQTQS